MVSVKKNDCLPLKPIIEVEIFGLWGIDFMGCLPKSDSYEYIVLVIRCMLRWVGAIHTRSNNHKIVILFIHQKVFSSFGCPRRIIRDGGTYFNNYHYQSLMKKIWVHHRITTPYHPQANEKVKVCNREIKKIMKNLSALMERLVN